MRAVWGACGGAGLGANTVVESLNLKSKMSLQPKSLGENLIQVPIVDNTIY